MKPIVECQGTITHHITARFRTGARLLLASLAPALIWTLPDTPAQSANDPGPIVRPYFYERTYVDDLSSLNPLSLMYQFDGTFTTHYTKDKSTWNRSTNLTSLRTVTTTNYVMNNLSEYLAKYNDGYYDETYDEYLNGQPWHPVANITTNSATPPSDNPYWNQLDYLFSYSGNYKRTEETKIELLAQGSTNIFLQRPYLVFVEAKDYPQIEADQGMNEEHAVMVPDGDITLLGEHPIDSAIVTNLNDGVTMPITPVLLSSYTNYAFSVSALRVFAAITMRFSGPITPLFTNDGIVTGPDTYNGITNFVGQTNLGLSPIPTPGGYVLNLGEFAAQVPTYHPKLLSGWAWRRDIDGGMYYWDNATNIVESLGSLTATPNAPPANGNDDPATIAPSSGFWDVTPDGAGMIYDFDGPALDLSAFPNAAVGTILAVRFNARQWLTWQGALASDVIYYHGKSTYKKISNLPVQWIRVGPNYTSSDHMQSVEFTENEAQSY